MQILINYDSSWRNSFLLGDNNQPIPDGGRGFVGSMAELGKRTEHYIARTVTKDTVMGLLNLLIGDVRKLYQSRQSEDYYFKQLEDKISFVDNIDVLNDEVVFLRNLNGNFDRNSFNGMIKASNPIFTSDYSAEFWGVLALDIEQLCDFILNDKLVTDFSVDNEIELSPVAIMDKFLSVIKISPKPCEGELQLATECLSKHFDKYKPTTSSGKVIVGALYASALYLQQKRLSERFDMSTSYAKRGGISGISHNTLTASDFMRTYSTGKGKLIFGNPYMQTAKLDGKKAPVLRRLEKANGQIVITIDVDRDKAVELAGMIDCAGTASFRLGKKGLAYIHDISI